MGAKRFGSVATGFDAHPEAGWKNDGLLGSSQAICRIQLATRRRL
jgi:hypothetical protein